VPIPAGVTDLIADILRTLPDATVTVTATGTVIAQLPNSTAFFVAVR